MKKAILIFTASLGLSIVANATTLSCQLDSNPEVKIGGRLTSGSASVYITDEARVLGLRELNAVAGVELSRVERKKEANYSFTKYYGEFNAWQDLEISVPKAMSSRDFKAYLTIYSEQSHGLIPGAAKKLSCTVE